MYAVRHDAAHDAVVYDEVTDWADDVDLSLEPVADVVPVRAPRRRRSSPLLVVVFALAFLAMLGLGAIGALVLGGAIAAIAVLMLAPRLEAPELPVVVEPPPAVVAPIAADAEPVPVETRAARPAAAKRAPPVAPPAGEPAPADDVDAQLVVMPDPGFRPVPVDRAARQLHERAAKGEIGAVAGH